MILKNSLLSVLLCWSNASLSTKVSFYSCLTFSVSFQISPISEWHFRQMLSPWLSQLGPCWPLITGTTCASFDCNQTSYHYQQMCFQATRNCRVAVVFQLCAQLRKATGGGCEFSVCSWLVSAWAFMGRQAIALLHVHHKITHIYYFLKGHTNKLDGFGTHL